jgi:murein DD-endopeptidase MepM/ murein hydrolase activator NlpD
MPDWRRFVVLFAFLAGTGFAAARHSGHLGGLRTAPAVIVASAPVHTVRDTLRSRETVSQLFARQGVNDVDWAALARGVRAFDPSRLRDGLVFNFRQRHGDSAPHAVDVRLAYDRRVHLVRGPDGTWVASEETIPWRTETFVIEGTVHSSVSDAITGAIGDEVLPLEDRIALVWSLADVYDWVVDFSRDVQPGDRFRVLAERMVSPEGEIRYGRVLAARLDVGPKPLYAYRYDDADGRQEFYDERARSMRRELLRAPLEFRRVSSGFSRRRFHPILRISRTHAGIDFAAAYGTPVRAVGDGVIVSAGRAGGYGNLVEIRHNGNRSSRYAHLSGFGPGVRAGARIRQGETVGYVGASGLATAAHLHYELRVGGRAVNPRSQFAAGEGRPIAAVRRAGYEVEMQRLQSQLEPPVPASPAAPATIATRTD